MLLTIPNISIECVSAVISKNRVTIEKRVQGIISDKKISRLKKGTGFEAFSVAEAGVCASDFCVAAAEKIFGSTDINRNDIGAIIFVTQTPDYFLPATSYTIQDRLNLPRDTATFDVGLGCSGFVHGLYICASLLQNLPNEKALLLCGDTCTRNTYFDEVAGLSVFGDAGSAAIISKCEGHKIFFNLQSFGELSDTIILRRGAYRNPLIVVSNSLNVRENFGEMDGAAVLDFSLKFVPPNLIDLMKFAGVETSHVEAFYLHQANGMMLKNLADILNVSYEKVPFKSARIGNTSSASIPVAMCEMKKVTGLSILSGFGVGMSIASAVIDLTNVNCLELGEL